MPSRESFRQEEQQIRQKMNHCQRAYLGWLVSNALFRRRSAEFHSMHHRMLQQWGLPDGESVNAQLRSRGIRSSERSRMLQDSRIFLDEWFLQRLWTPELPEPIGFRLLADDDAPQQTHNAVGMAVFLPWPLTRVRAVQLSILEHLQLDRRNDLSHMDGWLKSASATWGTVRYERMLDLHLYWFQALVQRYPDRLDRRIEKLDAAFAEYWNTDPEHQRQVRDGLQSAKLVRREYLKRCRELVSETSDSSIPDSSNEAAN